MNQGSTLDRVVRAFLAQLLVSQPAEFVIDERQQIIERRLIPLLSIDPRVQVICFG